MVVALIHTPSVSAGISTPDLMAEWLFLLSFAIDLVFYPSSN
jgi:hypothetical protein